MLMGGVLGESRIGMVLRLVYQVQPHCNIQMP